MREIGVSANNVAFLAGFGVVSFDLARICAFVVTGDAISEATLRYLVLYFHYHYIMFYINTYTTNLLNFLLMHNLIIHNNF